MVNILVVKVNNDQYIHHCTKEDVMKEPKAEQYTVDRYVMNVEHARQWLDSREMTMERVMNTDSFVICYGDGNAIGLSRPSPLIPFTLNLYIDEDRVMEVDIESMTQEDRDALPF